MEQVHAFHKTSAYQNITKIRFYGQPVKETKTISNIKTQAHKSNRLGISKKNKSENLSKMDLFLQERPRPKAKIKNSIMITSMEKSIIIIIIRRKISDSHLNFT